MCQNFSDFYINRQKTSKRIWAASWQNQQNGMCAQQRLRSAWAFAQSDQSSLCTWRKLGPKLPIECTAKTLIRLGRCPGWSETSLGAQSFCWFCHEAAHFHMNEAHIFFFQELKTCAAIINIFHLIPAASKKMIEPLLKETLVGEKNLLLEVGYMSHITRKPVFGGLQPGTTQTCLLSFRN